MKEKSGQFFWGLFFLTIGTLFFLDKFDILRGDFQFIWDIWPIVFIFIGIKVIAKKTIFAPIVNVVFGIFFGILIYGGYQNIIGHRSIKYDRVDNEEEYEVKKYNHPFNDELEYAELDLKSSAGTLVIKRSTKDLVKCIAKGSLANYNFDVNENDANAYITVELDNENDIIFNGKNRNKLELQLNSEVIWNMDLEIGAAKSWIDLSEYKVNKLKLKTGATDTKLTLSDLLSKTELFVEVGAAILEIKIPKNSGCKITGEMTLIGKDLDGFDKKDSDYYMTKNYDDAENIINIRIDGAIAKLIVYRY